jgi:hypothetical protein
MWRAQTAVIVLGATNMFVVRTDSLVSSSSTSIVNEKTVLHLLAEEVAALMMHNSQWASGYMTGLTIGQVGQQPK